MNLVFQSILKDSIVKLFRFRSVSLGFVSFRFVEYNKPSYKDRNIIGHVMHVCKNLENITHKLENDCNVAFEWFANNFMKLYADKCYLLVIGQRDVMIQLPLRLEVPKSLIALKRYYLEFILIASSPLTITSQNFAKEPVINFMHLPAYPRVWIITN